MLLHILLFDRAYNVTYWLNYSELRSRLRRRYTTIEPELSRFHEGAADTALTWRLFAEPKHILTARSSLLKDATPSIDASYTVTHIIEALRSLKVIGGYTLYKILQLIYKSTYSAYCCCTTPYF